MLDDPPLDDPAYQPRTLPVNGKPNPLVAKWGPRSQLRWFQRFWGKPEMPLLRTSDLEGFYCQSVEHTGPCCSSCIDEEECFGWPVYDDHCCCVGNRVAGS